MSGFRGSSFLAALCTVAVAALVGCSGEAATSFDPAAPCPPDGLAHGAYPELEGLVPEAYRAEPPAVLDSGRNCSDERLGTLADGFDEIRFAGGTWTFGGERSLVLAVFTARELTAEDMSVFYSASAEAGRRTEILAESEPVIAGRQGYRLDTTTSARVQTVVVWPGTTPDVVNVVITNDLPEARIQEAIESFQDGT